ncbi:MAG: type pilus assembly protein PilB [Actinomycetota bacterium]|nr:type pilus assembly protein PilB [Actinomycetota bacterium]
METFPFRHRSPALLFRQPLGEMLLSEGLITQAQLDAALKAQAERGLPLGQLLVEDGAVTDAVLMGALARQLGLEFVDLAEYPIDRGAVALLPEAMARRLLALPVTWAEDRLIVAMADPGNVLAVDDLRAVTGADVHVVVATRTQLVEAIDRFHRLDAEVDEVAQIAAEELAGDDDTRSGQDGVAREAVEDAPIVKFVNLLIAQAVADRASDIHVEPTETDLRIRFRVDGVLHEVMHSPRSIQGGVISRLKVMADINIAERRIPQDGRISLNVAGKGIDLRVATLPTVYGEKVVMRILDKTQARLSLPDLGFHPAVLPRFEACFRKPYGTILVTGPTGSGKSTTLYATLNVLNSTDKNVITVEDPVEYRLPGVNQVQVNPKAGLTFASALRSILRSDPDIVLVGEIRDRETATIAIEASLTGHLVLSTLHTNDAASTPMRLVEMGVEPFLVISALDCVVAQRLARRLCDRCREEYEPTHGELTEAGWPAALLKAEGPPLLYRAVGCAACSRTGYRGRLAVHEVMVMSEEIRRMVVERYSSDEIKKTALAQGMLTLREDGLVKVAQGKTTLEELFRVIA